MVLSAKVLPGVDVDEVTDALREEAYSLADSGLLQEELDKVQNKFESTFVYSQYKAADRAFSLCHYTWLGHTDLANTETEAYRRVTPEEVQLAASRIFCNEHENMLIIRESV